MEEINYFFGISKIAKKIAIDTTVNLITLLTLKSNISKDNIKTSKLILKIDITNIIKVEEKAANTDIV